MYTRQSKKMLPFDVLEILQQYTDENHRLSQREIEKILADRYDMSVDRRSIKRSLMDLIEMGCEIQYSEINRTVRDKNSGEAEEQTILTDFYIEREFTDCEIRLLIDELIDTKSVTALHKKQLISKLERLSSVSFRKKNRTAGIVDPANSNSHLFYILDILEEAIMSSSKVSLQYKSFKVGNNGRVEAECETVIVTPHDMKIINGDYLLQCSKDDETEVMLKIALISDALIVNEMSNTKRKERINNIKNKHTVTFLTYEDILPALVEEFGQKSIRVESCGEKIIVNIRMEEKQAVKFGIEYADSVTILSPENIRLNVMERLQNGICRYKAV